MDQGYFSQQDAKDVKARAYVKGGNNTNYDRIILIAPLTDSTKVIDFELLKDAGSVITGERRLNRNNRFFVEKFGFYVAQDATAAAAPLSSPLFTYPDASGLTTATATGTTAVWNAGLLKWEVNNTQKLGDYPLAKFLFDPNTGNDGYGSTMHTAFPLVLTIDGGLDNSFSLELPSGLTLNPGGSNTNYAILVFDGYNVKNDATGAQ